MSMTASEYQSLSKRTLLDKPNDKFSDEEIMQIWTAMGLAGEAGEICDYVKKGIFHRHGIDKEKLQEELGDLMWYVAGLATKFGLNLNIVLQMNYAKLQKRYPDGFKTTDSVNRNIENEKNFADALAKMAE